MSFWRNIDLMSQATSRPVSQNKSISGLTRYEQIIWDELTLVPLVAVRLGLSVSLKACTSMTFQLSDDILLPFNVGRCVIAIRDNGILNFPTQTKGFEFVQGQVVSFETDEEDPAGNRVMINPQDYWVVCRTPGVTQVTLHCAYGILI